MLEPAQTVTPGSHADTPAWPPPHDPRERIVATVVNGWEARVFAPADTRRAYLAAHGFAHLQLWHPAAHVSILTPSRLTGGHFEIFPIEGWKYPVADPWAVREIVQQVFRLTVPRPARLAALLEWFVRAPERQMGGAPPCPGQIVPPRPGVGGVGKNPQIDLDNEFQNHV